MKRSLPPMTGLLFDAGLPMIAFYGLRLAGASEWAALLGATLIAGARVGWVALRSRKITWFGALMVLVFGVGLAMAVTIGDPRILLLRNSVSSALIGTAFLVSLASNRPLTLIAFQTWRPVEAEQWQRAYGEDPLVRNLFRRAAAAWGIGLLTAALLRLPLVYFLPLDAAVAAAAVPGAVIMGGLGLWTVMRMAKVSHGAGAPVGSAAAVG